MTKAELKAAVKATGSHFFDKETVEFWRSILETGTYKSGNFVTSELDFFGEKRLYTVRHFDGKTVKTVGEFQGYAEKYKAIAAAKSLLIPLQAMENTKKQRYTRL